MPAYSLGTMGAWAVTSHTDQIITGAKTFQAAATASIPLTVKASSGQTGNLLEFRNSANGLMAEVRSTGQFFVPYLSVSGDFVTSALGSSTMGGGAYIGATLQVFARSTDNAGLKVRGLASQTANLQEWQNSAGTVLAYVTPAGKIFSDQPGTGASSFGFEVKKTAGGPAINLSNYSDADFQVILPATGAADLRTLISGSTNTPIALGTAMVERWRFSPDGTFLVRDNGKSDFGPNSTWAAWLRIGGNGYTVSTTNNNHASITTTNGNLHLDGAYATTTSGNGGIYFNWYNGPNSSGTQWGNGQSSSVANMSRTGAMTAVSFTSTSTMDSKREVERLSASGPDDDKLLSLQAVGYIPTVDDVGRKLYSFVAEEAAEVMPEIVSRDENNEITGINLTSLVTILTTQVQNLTARVIELETR